MARWRNKVRMLFRRPQIDDEPEHIVTMSKGESEELTGESIESWEKRASEERESEKIEEQEIIDVTCKKGLMFCCLNCCTCEGCSCSVDIGFKGSVV